MCLRNSVCASVFGEQRLLVDVPFGCVCCSCAVEQPAMSPLKSSRDIITHNDQGRRPPIPICNSINLKQMKELGFFSIICLCH